MLVVQPDLFEALVQETHELLDEYQGLAKRTVEIAIKIGHNLVYFRDKTGYGEHGKFLPWLNSEFALSQRTAYNFMSLADAEEKLKFAIIANLPLYILYELAPDSTPIQIVDAVVNKQLPATLPAIREAKQEAQAEQHEEGYTERVPFAEILQPLAPDKPLPEIVTPDPVVDEKEKRDAHVMRVMGSSESPEWYTPQEIVRLSIELLGEIDLDPCSNSHEAPNVPARTLYTKEEDGVSQNWRGKTYLNPPYGSEIPQWIEKLVNSYEYGDVEEALALLPARIDTQWFQPLYKYPMCNVRGRLQFENASNSAPFPSVIVYLGERIEDFIKVFKDRGPIMRRIG